MVATGSDCPTGKIQFASRAAAQAVVSGTRRRRNWRVHSFRCAFCGCWHIGNAKGESTKNRRRR